MTRLLVRGCPAGPQRAHAAAGVSQLRGDQLRGGSCRIRHHCQRAGYRGVLAFLAAVAVVDIVVVARRKLRGKPG